MHQERALMPVSPAVYASGERAEKYCIYPSEPLPGTSCLTFLIQRGIYSVSWCDCSSVGAPGGHLSVPGLPAGKRRRLHQIFWGEGRWRPAGEREEKSLDLQCDQMGERREEIWVRRAVWTEMWRKRAVLDGPDSQSAVQSGRLRWAVHSFLSDVINQLCFHTQLLSCHSSLFTVFLFLRLRAPHSSFPFSFLLSCFNGR